MLGAKRSGGLRLSVTDTVSQPVRRAATVVCHVTARQNRKVSGRLVKFKRPSARSSIGIVLALHGRVDLARALVKGN